MIQLLGRKEETALSMQIQNGSKEALDKLIQANLRLVKNIANNMARKYLSLSIPLDDLIGYGNIGLIMAAKKFKYQMGYKFSTYATRCIMRRIDREVIVNEKLIRLPDKKNREINFIKKCLEELISELNREPDIDELAKKTKMSAKKIKHLLSASSWNKIYINTSADESYKYDVKNLLLDSHEKNILDTDAIKKLEMEIRITMNKLSEREQFIIKKRFMEDEETSRKKIGSQLCLSEERIRQIEINALRKLRNSLLSKKKQLLFLMA